MPLFSFLIPIFNTAPDLVLSCLTSITTSLRTLDYEIIGCDDGSDASLSTEYKRLFENSGGRLLVNHRNLGMATSRNQAALQATGQYLFFVDSDDLIMDINQDLITKALSTHPSLVIADHINVGYDGVTLLSKRNKQLYVTVLRDNIGTLQDPFLFATFLFHPLVVRRDLFLERGGFSLEFSSGEEVDLHLRISQTLPADEVSYIPYDWYAYRRNPDSVVHNPLLYQVLISNLEKIIGRHASLRAGLAIAAHRIGRSTITGAAHYKLEPNGLNGELRPAWLAANFEPIVS